VFGWAYRYATLAINVNRLHQRRTGQPLIAYDGPSSWVEEWANEPIPGANRLTESAADLLTSLTELDLGGPISDDYIIDQELIGALRKSINDIMAALNSMSATGTTTISARIPLARVIH
jgi:hypothetical protein